MKVSYLFPIVEDGFDIKTFYQGLLESNFYNKYADREIFFVVKKNNTDVLDFLNQIAIRNYDFKIFTVDDDFDCQTAFMMVLEFVKGDVLLLGDTKIKNNFKIFELLMKKYEDGADIVQVKKRGRKIKEFFRWCFEKIYNGLSIFLVGKKDSFNITSLGLYCRDVLDIFKALPNKSCFLKNVLILNGFKTKVVFLNDNIETCNLNYSQSSANLAVSLSGATLNLLCFDLLLVFLIFGFNFSKAILTFSILLLVGLITFIIFGFKHILDIRANKFKTITDNIDMKNIDRIV